MSQCSLECPAEQPPGQGWGVRGQRVEAEGGVNAAGCHRAGQLNHSRATLNDNPLCPEKAS